MNLVLSGTGIDRQVLENTFSSAACKQYPWTTVHDIGAFTDDEKLNGSYGRPVPPTDKASTEWLKSERTACGVLN
jgi:hypothetical protein